MSVEAGQPMAALQTSRQSHISALFNVKLRAVTSIFVLVALGLQIGAVCKASGEDHDYYSYAVWVSPESFVFLGISFGWNIAELVVRHVWRRGLHPGAHVALDLILWTGLFAAGLLQLLINFWGALPIAAGVFKIFCALLHFTLFIYACIECDQRRRTRRGNRMVQTVTNLEHAPAYELSQTVLTQAIPPGMALVSIDTLTKLYCIDCEEKRFDFKKLDL